MTKTPTLSQADRLTLEAAIGHAFVEKERLDWALTHASARTHKAGNYERLEFLGDRVLGLCIAELLFRTFGTATEGELSVRLNQLVSAETCAAVADEMQLHLFIRTGADVKKLTGKRMLNVRADVVESLIAALYLDGGLEVARKFILRYWEGRAVRPDGARRDAKTELQEWAHAKFGVTPFIGLMTAADRIMIPLHGDGGSGGSRARNRYRTLKRAAEQVAATRILEREGIWQPQSAQK